MATTENLATGDGPMIACPVCLGAGELRTIVPARDPAETVPEVDICGACDGAGELPEMVAAHVVALEEDEDRFMLALEADEAARADL